MIQQFRFGDGRGEAPAPAPAPIERTSAPTAVWSDRNQRYVPPVWDESVGWGPSGDIPRAGIYDRTRPRKPVPGDHGDTDEEVCLKWGDSLDEVQKDIETFLDGFKSGRFRLVVVEDVDGSLGPAIAEIVTGPPTR